MFRPVVHAIVAVLLVATGARAAIVDPVFVRGNKRSDGWFDHLAAFESASDMVQYQNQSWTQAMSNPNYGKSAFFDGTNYSWVDPYAPPSSQNYFFLHDYGAQLENLINDSGADTHSFYRTSSDNNSGTWFADSEGGIYNFFYAAPDSESFPISYIRRYASIADVLNDNGTSHRSHPYSDEDRFFAANGKYYRTDTGSGNVIGIDVFNSFDDLLTGNASVKYNGGVGSSDDLFMVVPRAALPSGGPPSVPEIDPAGLGSILTLLGGGLALLERRRTRD